LGKITGTHDGERIFFIFLMQDIANPFPV